MKAIFFAFVIFVVSCNAQSSSSAATSAPGCIGNCIDLACPTGYTCNTTTQQCCASSSTPTPACVDKVGPKGYSECAEKAFLCNNTLYYDLMTDQCPRTCRRGCSVGRK